MGKIRASVELRETLRELASNEYVRAHADDAYSPDDSLYNYVLSAIVPEDPGPDDVINQEMVYVHGVDDSIKARIDKMAGDNVPAHRVIERLIDDVQDDGEQSR